MSDSADPPLVYLVLGAAGSGRREVLADLIDGGLGGDERAAVLLSAAEAPDEFDARLPGLTRWTWTDGRIEATLPAGATRVFFVTDGRAGLVDQVEAFKPWLAAQGGELARVLCVVHCRLAELHPPLLAWFEAGVHFADIVLLNRREGVANKWLSGFRAHFAKQFYPCLFEPVKAGRVANPALVLEPQARRLSHFFDEDQDWVFTDGDGGEIDEQEEADDEAEVTAAPEEDPYFVRDAAGRRVKKIPDMAKYLPPGNPPV
jgi:hypothetical protein